MIPQHQLDALVAIRGANIAIIDLDNCISEDNWRWPLFDLHLPLPNDRYTRYHNACEGDAYQNADVIRDIARSHDLIVFTSRPEVVRSKTQRWLNRWRVPAVGVYMRPNDNHDSSTVLKRKMLLSLPSHLKPTFAIDDRHDILDMYASEGVNVVQQVIIHQPEVNHP